MGSVRTRFINKFAKFENLDEIGASDQYMTMGEGNNKTKYKKLPSRMNDDDGGDDTSFQKKHKPEDFDDSTPF
ncbi:MAG: hypothetical protein NTX38_00680 [Methylobacter sp.]|nr:hypothetical protein [Methylobacter sp.]